jgi:anti-sigma factor RsiW
MHNDELKQLLHGYVCGELTSEELQRVNEHLPSCPSCSEDVSELRRMQLMFEAREPYALSPWFSTKLMARIQAEEADSQREVESFSRRFVIGFALLVLLLVGSSLLQKEELMSFYGYFAQASSPTEQTVLSGGPELSREDILKLAFNGNGGNNR